MVNDCYLYKREAKSCNYILLWCLIAYKLWDVVYGLLEISWAVASSARDKIWPRNIVVRGENMWISFLLLFYGWCARRETRGFFRGVEEEFG